MIRKSLFRLIFTDYLWERYNQKYIKKWRLKFSLRFVFLGLTEQGEGGYCELCFIQNNIFNDLNNQIIIMMIIIAVIMIIMVKVTEIIMRKG